MKKPLIKPIIKIVKKAQRERCDIQSENGVRPVTWSQHVRSWVTEFRKDTDNRRTAAFAQLFSKQ